ncbi:hypothetical protein ACFX2C_026524 [Malus domestica]
MVLFLYPLFDFEKVVMLGVWLSRFGGRCLFDFGASNLVGSVFSNSDVVGVASFTCSTLAENFGKIICEVFDRMPIISAKLSVRVTGADKARKVGASSISEIGPRDSGSSVSSIFEKVIMLGVWLSRFGGRCLFDFGASNLVRSIFSNSCWESGSRDSEDGASSILEQAILLGVFSRISGTIPLPLWSDVVGAASFTCSTLAENFGKVICEVFDRLPIISAKLSVRVTGADKAGKVGASSISEIGPRGLWGAQLLRKRAPLRFLRSAFEAPLRFLKLRRVQIFIGAGIKFQSTLESPPAAPPSPDNIWRPSFVSLTGPLTVGDSVMKNDMTAAVVARNLLTPKDNRLLSKRSDELAVKDSLALSVQCAGSVSNMAQRLFARTRQVESLAAEVMSLKQEIRGLKHENKQLHRLAHDYATNMKRKLDQMKETDGQVLLDHQRFVGLFQRHLLPSSSGAVPRNEAPNDQPLMPPPSRVLSSTEAPNDPPPVPSLSGALPTTETSPKQPL